MNNVMSWVEQWAEIGVVRTYVGIGLLGAALIATLAIVIYAHFRDRSKHKDKKDKRK